MSKNKKGKVVQFQPISFERYIKENARKLSFSTCYILGDEDNGMPQVIITRQKRNGSVIAGFYLVDKFCLGLKNTFVAEFDDLDQLIEEFFEENNLADQAKEIDPIYAMNLIYGAIEYAEDAGFAPAKDFKLTEYILDAVEELEYIEIEFGKDGRYFYSEGPEDNSDKILATLEKNIGKGNFDFITGGAELFDEEDDEEDEDDGEDDDDEDYVVEDLVERYIDQIEEFDNKAKVDNDFQKNLLSVIENNYGKSTLDKITFLAFVTSGLLMESLLFPDFENKYKSDFTQTVEDLKSKFYKKHSDLFKAGKTEFSDFDNLPVDAIIFNNLVFRSYMWIYLDDHLESLKNLKIEDKKVDIAYFDFTATLKERISFYFFCIAIDLAKNVFRFDLLGMSEDEQKTVVLSAIDLFEEFQNDDIVDEDFNYDLRPFAELELIFYYYLKPSREELLEIVLELNSYLKM